MTYHVMQMSVLCVLFFRQVCLQCENKLILSVYVIYLCIVSILSVIKKKNQFMCGILAVTTIDLILLLEDKRQ